MSDFLYNTLYTNYAFNKLATNMANDGTATYNYSPYNLIKVKIGSGDNTADLDKLSLSKALYEININEVKVTGTGTITFICEIPEDLSDIEITEIGLFDVIDGEDKLFSYSRVQLLKPADLGYELVIELNLTLKTVNFHPNIVHVIITEYDMATQEMINNLEKAFMWIEANLERIIDYNAEETGKNRAQVLYNEELIINNSLYGTAYASKYFSLLNKFGSNLINAFFIKPENYLSYSINDMATDYAYLNIYSNKIESAGDNINFNSASTLSVNCKLGEFTNNSSIINKIYSASDVHFSLNITSNRLNFNLGGRDIFSLSLSDYELNYLKNNYVTYTISFSGPWNYLSFYLYLDGVLKNTTTAISMDPPTYTTIALRNYDPVGSVVNNNIETTSVVFINRLIDSDEAYFLNMSQKRRNYES